MTAQSRARAQQRSQGRAPQPVQPAHPRPGPIDLEEARRKAPTPSVLPRSLSAAWDETEALGIDSAMRRSGASLLSEQERKETLYKAYINNVWISACVDAIAKRITSGGFIIEEVEQGKGSEANRQLLQQLVNFVNDDDDFLQLVRAIITDLGIYGEAYMEIVNKAGKPFSLHKIDCQTMSYRLEPHGRVVQYLQSVEHSTDTVSFQPDEVIRWWLPDPKAHKKALSPIERILGPTDTSTRMADWQRQFFRRGARPPFWIKYAGSKDEAARFVAWLRENYTGQQNAHIPMVLYDDAELFEIGKGAIDIDFAKGHDQMRQEILAGYQVPPAILSQIESGNIGGGTGESQDKSFQFNACDPFKQLFFEKFNYRVVQKGFGITDWKINSRYADYRSDEQVSSVQDKRIRNGSNTVNEIRAELGKKAVDGGDEAVIVASREIVPIARLKQLADEQAQSAQIDIETKQAGADLAKVKADQAKNPPKPPSISPGLPGQPPQPGQVPPQLAAHAAAAQAAAQGKPPQLQSAPGKPQAPPRQPKQAQESANHAGIMVAFMLSPDVAAQLAVPGGEPAEDLHVTLAYLGDADEWTPAQQQGMQRIVSAFARSHPALSGRLSGVGRFNAPEGEPEPVYASVDVPDLPAFRQALVKVLADGGYIANKEHGFTPHCTLAYLEPDEPTPVQRLGAIPLLFDRLLLAIGDQQYIFLLSGTKQEERFPRVILNGKSGHALWPNLLREDDGPSPATAGMVSKQGSCNCDICRANAGQPVEKPPPFHDGCDCSLEAQEASDPKAPAASGSRPGGVLMLSRKT